MGVDEYAELIVKGWQEADLTPEMRRIITVPLLLAIVDTEVAWGKTKLLKDVRGTPDNIADDVGDRGHGHGLFQIDDRAHGQWLELDLWDEPDEAAEYVIEAVLLPAWRYLRRKFPDLPASMIERGMIAAYNCGAGNVKKAITKGLDVDHYTAHHRYSKSVMNVLPFWKQWYSK